MDRHVEEELLAYLDGELDARQRALVEAHLERCTACAAELERLRRLRQDLDATFDAALGPVRLPAAADRRIRERLRTRTERRPWWRIWRRRGIVAQAALALLVLLSTFLTTQTLRLPSPPGPQETLVVGQERLAPGSPAGLRVIVRDGERAEPIPGAEVVVRIGRTAGLASVVFTGRTDAHGTAEVAFTVPDDLEGEASLVVETASAGGEDRIIRPITIARDYKLFLNSDKPAYRPGQTVHLRALALDGIDLRPVEGQEIRFGLYDDAGREVERVLAPTSDFGIAAADLALPPDAAHGLYILRAELGDTVSERTVRVDDYELPTFRITVDTDGAFYGPGDRVAGTVTAGYFFPQPVAEGRVTLRGYAGEPEGTPLVEVTGETDDEGRFPFAFDLPSSFGRHATDQPDLFTLQVQVTDQAGRQEGVRRTIPVAAQPILIDAIPESGLLKPRVENILFILTTTPDGRPVETTLTVRVAGEEHLLSTDPYGLAAFRFTPADPAQEIQIQAQTAQGERGEATFTFVSDPGPQMLLLRAERAAYEIGETLRLEALTNGEGSIVYLDVVRSGQTVATLSAPAPEGRATFALDLDGTMVGTLELHAYLLLPDGGLVEDTRLVVVDTSHQVDVAITADQAAYRPGETAHLELEATTESGSQPTAIGIGVVDESVYGLETLPPGFARAYFLLEQEMVALRDRVPVLDEALLLDAEGAIKAAQDRAAQAAWAPVPPSPTLSFFTQSMAEDQGAPVMQRALANGLGLLLVLLPLLLAGVVVWELRATMVLSRALRRVGLGGLVLLVVSPVLVILVGGMMGLLWLLIGIAAPLALLAVALLLFAGLAIHGWRRGDPGVQLASSLVGAYLAMGGMVVYLAAAGASPPGLLLALVVAAFLLTVAALATLGQGLLLEGWRLTGWATTLLALLLILIALYLPFIPQLSSDLTRALGSPALYAGPVGWMTGCATRAPTMEAPTEEPPGEVEEPTDGAIHPTIPSPPIPPAEPFPLRQVFPETLYWAPELLTDEEGQLTLDLPLADTITTWRLTALASTREGGIGVATYDLPVFQDLFIILDLPATLRQGEEVAVTATVYNYLPEAQTLRLEIAPGEGYTLLSAPVQSLTVPSGGAATATFRIRADGAGHFPLRVVAVGEGIVDRVVREVVVEP